MSEFKEGVIHTKEGDVEFNDPSIPSPTHVKDEDGKVYPDPESLHDVIKVVDESSSDDLKKDEAEDIEEEDETLFSKFMPQIKILFYIALGLLLVVYLLAAFIIDFQRAKALFVITVLVLAWNAYAFWAAKNPEVIENTEAKVLAFFEKTDTNPTYGGGLVAFLVIIMAIIMAVTVKDGRNMISFFGMIVMIGLTWVFSYKPFAVKVRTVIGALFMQFLFGWAVIRTDWGFNAIEFSSDVITTLLNYTYAGSGFVFNWLTDGSLFAPDFAFVRADGSTYSLGPPFFMNVLPTVIFFSALMSMGYYLRAIPWMVNKLGYFFAVLLGTSASESLSAAGNIFVGQTEAPLLVRPFLSTMTDSELHAVMTGGFATIAGSVFGIYVSFGVDGTALLAASIMSAPAALAISKITLPETEESPTKTGKKGSYDIPPSGDVNIVHAASTGAVQGTKLMLNIAGNLIAFLAIIEMLDQLLIYLGDRVDIALSFNILCEIIFFPFAWLMGVDPEDCDEVAICIGLKLFANEFVAYERLAFTYRSEISERSYYIAAFALCGFSNFGSIGIQLGGLTPMAPNKGKKLAKYVMSAMIAGNTACFLTACIAGIFYEGD